MSRGLLVSVIGVVVGAARPAEACLCEPIRFSIPADGAQGVPVNGHVVVAGHGSVTLRDADGGAVPLDVVATWQADETPIVEYAPRTGLSPGAAYVVNADGHDIAAFSTSGVADEIAPATPVIDEVRLELAPISSPWDSSCSDERQRLVVAAAYDPDVVGVDVKILGDASQTFVVPPDGFSMIGGPDEATCRVALVLNAGTDYCVELRARDAAGNLSAPSRTCSTTLSCDPVSGPDDDPRNCSAGGCAVGRRSDVWPLALALVPLRVRARRRRRTPAPTA